MKTAIVIGGGIAGCSTAYALAQRGSKVTLIERHENLAQEASGNPLAVLYPKFNAKADASSQLALHGFQFTLKLLRQLTKNVSFFNACGQIQLVFNIKEQTKQNALLQAEYLQKYSKLFRAVTSAEASEIAGITLNLDGLYLPQAGWVKPALLCKNLVNSPLITVVTASNVLSINKSQNLWRVSHANGALEAENVVICSANDIKQFPQCQSAVIIPVRGQVNFFTANTKSSPLKTIICSDHYLSPAVDSVHSIGTTFAPNDANANLSAIDTLVNLKALKQISPEIFVHINANQTQGRVAWRSQTLDYMPLAGQLLDETKLRNNPPRYNAKPADLPWLSGLYVNAGHGSKGMITAPICGELIANLITNNPLHIEKRLASRMNPSRFLLRELGLKQLAQSLYD